MSRLARSRRPASVDELIARGRYAKALKALRSDFERRQPTAAERLRMADLLVLSNRSADAMPILLGVADEQVRFGFPEKALEALKRASDIEPGRADIERRIAEIGPERAGTSLATPDTGGTLPSTAERLRMADQLAQDDQRDEAVMILLAVADEQARRESYEEALEALRRASKVEPGRPDIGRRIAKIREAMSRPRVARSLPPAADDSDASWPPVLGTGGPGPEPASIAAPAAALDPSDGIDLADLPELLIDEVPEGIELPELELLEVPDEAERHPGEAVAEEPRPLLTEAELEAEGPGSGGPLPARAGQEVSEAEMEEAVRSLLPGAGHPDLAAAALQEHFGSSRWSPQVRTSLARLMLDAGRMDASLAILVSVARDLARFGRARKAIRLLQTLESIREKGVDAIDLVPNRGPRAAQGASTRGAPEAAASPAARKAAFREWLGLLIRATDQLAARSAPPRVDALNHDLTIHSSRTQLLALQYQGEGGGAQSTSEE